jgi:hypothetical protein
VANSVFCSVNEPDQWIAYDFKDRSVKVTHYSIRSFYGEGEEDLKSWVIEGSNDGKRWMELDRRVNNWELNSPDVIRTFQVTKSEECRIVRLRQIDQNHAGSDCICICSFELFGSLIEELNRDF